MSGIPRAELLLLKGQKYKEKAIIKREELYHREIEGCTFEPALNKHRNKNIQSKIKYDDASNTKSSNTDHYEGGLQELLEKNMNSLNQDDIIRSTDSRKRSPNNFVDLSAVQSDSEKSDKQKYGEKFLSLDNQYKTFGGKL